jgi:hypothetical protein
MASYRERYFAEAVPQVADRARRVAQRLSRLLFPSILVSKTHGTGRPAGWVQ